MSYLKLFTQQLWRSIPRLEVQFCTILKRFATKQGHRSTQETKESTNEDESVGWVDIFSSSKGLTINPNFV